MSNIIKCSSLHNGKLTQNKLSKIKKHNIDTLLLNRYYYDESEGKNNELGIKNIIIDENKENDKYIKIWNTKAENIYFNNQENLGGITFSHNKLDYNLTIGWRNKTICNIKEINIIMEERCEKIELDENVREIDIGGYVDNSNIKEFKGIMVYIESNHYNKKYYFSFDGKNYTDLRMYNCDKNLIENGVLDLREVNYYNYVTSDTLSVDTLIINKNQIETLHSNFDEKLFVKTIKIYDENNMKLIPYKEIEFNDVLLVKTNYLVNKDLSKIIFLDDKENIKIYDKEELLKNDSVEDVKFIINSDCDLIVIKYKNSKYKVIDLNKEYEIDYLFSKFLELNLDIYFDSIEKNILKECIKNRDFFTPFEKKIIDNNLLHSINKDFLEFEVHLVELNKIGLSYAAIKYLVDKNYVNIINPKTTNILKIENINNNEIEKFNELGESYKVLRKVKRK